MPSSDGGRRPHVIWISGFSASGKTTVGRRVDAMLRSAGAPSIFLDGDDLRSIFAGRWGYEREDRIELARVYFRLCSHLTSQGFTVVISAVAMYDDVRAWVKDNVPGSVEVYLDVPEAERIERDRTTKRVYDQIGSTTDMYDEPKSPDLVVPNHGSMTVEEAAQRIVDFVQSGDFRREVDHGRSDHWARFYSRAKIPQQPSSFALAVADRLPPSGALLDVGCGNGRDASYFASMARVDVLGLDVSEAAIESCRQTYSFPNLQFFAGRIEELESDMDDFDVIYSRFCLHAMTPLEQEAFVRESVRRLRDGGLLFVECRSIKDPLARKGEVISKTERIFGHYRRFIIAEEFVEQLTAAGYSIEDVVESDGLAKFGEDDPVVIRVSARVGR